MRLDYYLAENGRVLVVGPTGGDQGMDYGAHRRVFAVVDGHCGGLDGLDLMKESGGRRVVGGVVASPGFHDHLVSSHRDNFVSIRTCGTAYGIRKLDTCTL